MSIRDPPIATLRLVNTGGDGDVSCDVDHCAGHVEEAVDAEDDADPLAGDADGLKHEDD